MLNTNLKKKSRANSYRLTGLLIFTFEQGNNFADRDE